MTRALPAGSLSAQSAFTPSTRRDGVSPFEIAFARNKRAAGVSWDAIANMLGRRMHDLREVCRAAGVL